MNEAEILFDYVNHHAPEVMNEILLLIRPYSLTSVISILQQHMNHHIKSLRPFNQHRDNIAPFLLHFTKIIRRNFPQPGEPRGILLTCRVTHKFTQTILDGRHLKYEQNTSFPQQLCASKYLKKQINTFVELSQIFELSQNNHYFQMFTDMPLDDLLNMNNACIPLFCRDNDADLNQAYVGNTQRVTYMNMKKYIIMPSFLSGINRVLYRKKEALQYLFSYIPAKNILALTDIKYVYEKCGIVCFFYNFLNVLRYQFFRKISLNERIDFDIISLIKFQCSTGVPLPLNRNGLKKNPNRSGLEKLCFEAVKQTWVDEMIAGKTYPVKDSTSKMYFGQRFNEGTGYCFTPVISPYL